MGPPGLKENGLPRESYGSKCLREKTRKSTDEQQWFSANICKEQTKSKPSQCQEIIKKNKIRTENNEIETKETVQRINK